MKEWMVWVALGGLVSACALEASDPGTVTSSSPRRGEGPPAPPSTPPPGGFGGYAGGGTAQPGTVGGAGGASGSGQTPLSPGAVRRPRDSSSGCSWNEDCGSGLCVNERCQAFCAGNAGCAEGDACVLGLCRPDAGRGWECIDQADCADAEDCVGGGCLRRCLRDGHCATDEEPTCSFGYCGLIR